MAQSEREIDIKMDAEGLYREEMFTDRRVGTIQRLTPIDGNGEADSSRETLYVGQTQLMTQAGPLPLSFEIPAKSLADAANGFADGANGAVEEAMQRLEEMRREQASSIIVPDAAGGGVPPGGKLQMP